MKKTLFVTLLLLSINACQHLPYDANRNRITVGQGITLQLLLPKNRFTATQKITARYRNPQSDAAPAQETQHTLLMQVQASPQNIVLAGLAPSGTRLFSLQFDGNKTEVWQSPLFSLQQIATTSFDARYALADFELTSFPQAQLQSALSRQAQLIDNTKNGIRTRELRRQNGDTVIHIEYRATQTEYCHRERHYCLLIENLP